MDQNTFLVGEFEGPLDLLLFLIKKQEINIYDIPIAKITEQYLAYLEYASQIELDNLTDFYLMAATLLYIKSKMLLPVEVNLDDEIEAINLAKKLGWRPKPGEGSPAYKPGSYMEYLDNHPEEVDRILREHGIDPDEINRILEQGGGILPGWNGKKNKRNQT